MKYYYLDGIDKLGPYSLEEIKSRNLSNDTMILREDRAKWVPLSDFDEFEENVKGIELDDNTKVVNIKKSDNNKKNSRFLKFSLPTILILIVLFFLYQRFSLTEDEARILANRFFNAVIIENLDYNSFDEIYPDFKSIGSRIDFQNACVINNISSNSNGDYEVYASYNHSKIKSYPIYLLIGKEKSKVFIKSSRGINYAFYDKTYDYGKKKGCFSGNEDDVKIGKIIYENNLTSDFEYLVNLEMSGLYENLEISSKFTTDFIGWTRGEVTIKNNNYVGFDILEFDCRVEFYDKEGKLNKSEKVYISDLDARSSSSASVSTKKKNSTNYKVIPTIKKSQRLENLIKERVIEETKYGCF